MNDEIQTGELVPISMSQQVAIAQAETSALIDKQISTARAFPRSITKFLAEMKTNSTVTKDIAATMFYRIPRGGKQIMGPSVRLAEVAAQAFGNLRIQAQVVEEGEKEVTARWMSHDLEKNVAFAGEVFRRCTDRDGKRYNDDMMANVKNVAISIAKRQAVFAAIPKAFIESAREECMRVALADGRTIADRRKDMITRFREIGVSEPEICKAIHVDGMADVGEFQIQELIGIYAAIKNGEQVIEDYFTDDETIVRKATEEMKSAVAENRTGKRKANKPTDVPPPIAASTEGGLLPDETAQFEAENPSHEHP